MTAPTEDVDWAAVERRGRRLQWLAAPLFPLYVLAIVGVDSRFDTLPALLGWVVLVAAVLVVVGLAVVGRGPDRRRRAAEARRIQYAIRHRVDPGPDLRERADRQARTFARSSWLGLVFPMLLVSYALNGRWDHPVRTSLALLVTGSCFLGVSWWYLSQARAARRWLTDPPGPARVAEADPSARRWPWLGIVAVTCLALGLLLGLVAALLD